MATTVLGLNAYHGDSSACLLVDGALVAAAEEERFRRQKHWAGLPTEAIRCCLREAGMTIADVDHVAVNRDPRANRTRKVRYTLARRPAPRLVIDRLRNARAWASLDDELRAAFPGEEVKARLHHFEHHRAHLASAFLVSPYQDAVAVSVDGFGDFASAAWGFGEGDEIRVGGRVYFPHSLGIFYQALTQYLGFPNFGDEYKVMGLAPYGKPAFRTSLEKVVLPRGDGGFALDLRYFRHHREDVGYTWRNTVPETGPLFSHALEELLGPARKPSDELTDTHRDLARSVQEFYEERFFTLLQALHERYRVPRLVVCGGCAANSVANGKIQLRTSFEEVYVPPAAGDGGGSVGAALLAQQQVASGFARFVMDHAAWGPGYGRSEIEAVLSREAGRLEEASCRIEEVGDIRQMGERTARAIANGEVVGWFQGRMELGPRALGNRSIVCDPRRADMKEILNRKIKRRESFRPFAPSVLREAADHWFESDADVPFMSRVFQIRPERREAIPAVTHVDGSGRLQTVDRESHPLYHGLISAFHELTGVPMVLNTSFNENEPIVCTPEEALDCFLRTKMDVLALENFILTRPGSKAQGERDRNAKA